ncbi:MAG: ATPase, T2SS/T4P/T4SS family [Planctomycetota bacterium]
MTTDAKKGKFGELLVQAGLVTQAQLDQALQVQKEQEDRQSIGRILVDLGYLTQRRLRGAAKRFGKRLLVGELLVTEGAITRKQLEKALREHKATGHSLGKVLVGAGVVSEDDLARALGRQLDMPYMVPHAGMVDMQVFTRLPEQFIRSNSVLPVAEKDGEVTVVVADPVDGGLIQRLEKVLGENLRLTTSSKSRIDKVIEELMFRRELGIGAQGMPEDEEGTASVSLSIDSVSMTGGRGERGHESIFDGILLDAVKKKASDIHFEPQRDRVRVRYRIDGMLVDVTRVPLSLAGPFVRRAKALARLSSYETRKQQEGRLSVEVDGEQFDLRVGTFPSIFGETMAIHCFSREIGRRRRLDDLGMHPGVLATFRASVERSLGATLFVGPTGSGKTTTFYTVLSHLNDGTRKIISVEAPVELTLEGVVQHSLQEYEPAEMVGGLLSAMQHDPDVIALGAIVSDEVAEKLLEVAMMGHKVFSTMHAEDAVSALVRLRNLRGTGSFLACCTIVLVAQVLARRTCRRCAEVYIPSPKLVSEFEVKDVDLDAIDFRRGIGCSDCMGTGFRGRTAIFEVMEAGAEMQKALREGTNVREIRHAMRKGPKFVSLRQAGFLKAAQGLTTLEEVARVMAPAREEGLGGEARTLDELCRLANVTVGQGFRERKG